MKILFVSNLYPPFQIGGYEILCHAMAIELQKRGHEIKVLTSSRHYRPVTENSFHEQHVIRSLGFDGFEPNEVYSSDIRNWKKAQSRLSQPSNTAVLLNQISDFKPDCIYLFNLVGIGGLALVDAINCLNYPHLFYLADRVPLELAVFPKNVLNLYQADTFKIYEKGEIICMSNTLLKEIEILGGSKFLSTVNIIPGWADAKEAPMERSYLLGGNVKFITAGTVKEHKGISLIIKAAAELQNRGINNFQIEVYGSGDIEYYQKLAYQHGATDKIEFKGPRKQSELMEIYKKSDVFLFPTWEREPFGLAPLEAAAMGCVPIITGQTGVAEFIHDQEDCLKIERTVEALAEQMSKVCKNTVDLKKLGWNGQILARENLAFKTNLDKIEAILIKVARDNPKPCLPTWETHTLVQFKHDMAQKMLFSGKNNFSYLKNKHGHKIKKWVLKTLNGRGCFTRSVLRRLIALRIIKSPG